LLKREIKTSLKMTGDKGEKLERLENTKQPQGSITNR